MKIIKIKNYTKIFVFSFLIQQNLVFSSDLKPDNLKPNNLIFKIKNLSTQNKIFSSIGVIGGLTFLAWFFIPRIKAKLKNSKTSENIILNQEEIAFKKQLSSNINTNEKFSESLEKKIVTEKKIEIKSDAHMVILWICHSKAKDKKALEEYVKSTKNKFFELLRQYFEGDKNDEVKDYGSKIIEFNNNLTNLKLENLPRRFLYIKESKYISQIEGFEKRSISGIIQEKQRDYFDEIENFLEKYKKDFKINFNVSTSSNYEIVFEEKVD